MDELLDDLNEQQRQAVLHDGGPLLVVAGQAQARLESSLVELLT